MTGFWQDLRYGFRSLWKSRSVTAIAVLALTVGIGATTAIFSVVQAVLLQPLPFRQQDQLAVAWKRDAVANHDFVELSYPEYVDWRAQTQVFEDLLAMPTTVYGYGYILTGEGDPVQLESARVTANFFSLLGANAALGRIFTEEEVKQSTNRVVVLNDRLWRDRFSANPGIVGKTITLNGTGYEVIGVMPREFDFPKGADLWTPLATNQPSLNNRSTVFMQAVGRLKQGATLEQAQAELNTIISRVAQEHPETQAGGQSVVISPLSDHIFGTARPALYLLLAASGLLLLIACANITNLLLARATTRRREIAVRAALGAGRRRLMQQLLTESLLLAVIGGVLGLLLSYLLIWVLIAVAPTDIPRLDEVRMSGQVLIFTLVVMLLTTVLFGLAPAFASSNIDLNESLREGGTKMAGGARGNKLRHAFVVAEVAITLVLLIGAGLIFRTFMNLRKVDLGFNPQNVLTMQLNVHGPKYAEAEQRRNFYSQLVQKLEAQSGVASAGVILLRPLEGPIGWDVAYMTEGQSIEDAKKNPITNYQVITPNYFRAMGIPLVSGRELTEQDTDKTQPVIIISETMARNLFPRGDAVGQRIKLDPSDQDAPWRTIIGVVRDARYRQLGTTRLDVYVAHRQTGERVKYLIVRTSSNPMSVVPIVRRELASLDPNLTVTGFMTGDQLVARAIARPRFNTLLLACLGIVAALLALTGIYGIVAYIVTQRTREIGIRMALGAGKRDVLKLVLLQGMKPVLLGVALGLAVAFAATRVVSNLLYGVSATDPITFIGISLLLVAVALIACLLPMRRATKVDPMLVLRYE